MLPGARSDDVTEPHARSIAADETKIRKKSGSERESEYPIARILAAITTKTNSEEVTVSPYNLQQTEAL